MVVNVAMTADGKISTVDRSGSWFVSRDDRKRMDVIRAGADLIVVGGETARRENPPFHIRDAALVLGRVSSGYPPHPDVLILSKTARLPETLKVFSQSLQKVWVATPGEAGETGRFSKALVGVLTTEDPPCLARLLGSPPLDLYRSILVEGGGETNAAFFREGLVDEVFVTLCPVVLGGRAAPTPVGGGGLPVGSRPELSLLSCERVGDELFLHYAVGREGRR